MKIIIVIGMSSMPASALKKKFSFPYRFGEMPSLKWFNEHQELILDIYINPDVFGLTMQAMNGPDQKDNHSTFEFLKEIKNLGIKICCTLNNVFDPVTIDEFLNIDKKYLELIDILVVPTQEWLSLKYLFEIRSSVILDLTITDLRKDSIWSEFDCVYIHGDNLRNVNEYSSFNNLGAVVNFNDCVSWCTIKNSHYSSLNKEKFSTDGFCPTKKMLPDERLLAVTRIPPFLSEYIFYAQHLKVFKLQGRGTTDTFQDSINIIENIHLNKELLTPDAKRMQLLMPGIELYKWLREIRNTRNTKENNVN